MSYLLIQIINQDNNSEIFDIIYSSYFTVPPKSVVLKIGEDLSPEMYTVKFKENNMCRCMEMSIDCIAEQARPKPSFEWRLGDDVIKVGVNRRHFYGMRQIDLQ